MDRQTVVNYLNYSLQIPYGGISINDAKVFNIHIEEETGQSIHPNSIINAAQNSPPRMLEKYKEGLWNALIKKYEIEVVVLLSMGILVNGKEQSQISGYR